MSKNDSKISFGTILASIRINKGLTQSQLGKLIGVSQRVIAYYEKETKYHPKFGRIILKKGK